MASTQSKKSKKLQIATLSFEINAESCEIQLTPHGLFNARDGRPTTCKNWNIDSLIAKRVIKSMSRHTNDTVIDYEHQTLNASKNGQKAEAAGWYSGKNAVYREGVGLFVTGVEWTAQAKQEIQEKKYRYISPVIIYDARTGEIHDIYNAALTNNPALDGMGEVKIAAASNLILQQLNNGEFTMNEILELLKTLLGLPSDATEEQVLQMLQEIQGDVASDAASNLITLLESKDKKVTALSNEVSALKTAALALKGKPSNDNKLIAELTQQVSELSLQINGDKKERLIQAGLTNGKLIPSMTKWAETLSVEGLAAFLDNAPVIANLSDTQTGGKPPKADRHGLDDFEIEAASLAGLTPEEYANAKKEIK